MVTESSHTPARIAPRQRAFTLVELLVVVAIVALLLGILVPSLSQARQAAQSTACLSNMRSMALATTMYAEANRQFLPGVGMSHGSHQVDAQGSWFVLLEEFAGNDLLYRCPNDKSEYFETPPAPGARLRKVSFATNYYVSGDMGGYLKFNRLSQIERPISTIFALELTEGTNPDGSLSDFYAADHVHPDQFWAAGGDFAANARTQMAIDRHRGEASYAMLDGHAESLPFEQTMDLSHVTGPPPAGFHWAANKYDPTVAR